jgi:hypothetical protein
MGFIRHDAIVVTAWSGSQAEAARGRAIDLKLPVTDLTEGEINGYVSFLIAPDGSKEGWEDSDYGDKARKEWIKWANEMQTVDWAHVSFGGDQPEAAHLVDFSDSE